MCFYEQPNIKCMKPHCDRIVDSESNLIKQRCKAVKDKGRQWGKCGVKNPETWNLPARKSDKHRCAKCELKAYMKWMATQEKERKQKEREKKEREERERELTLEEAIALAEMDLADEVAIDSAANAGSSSGQGDAVAHEEFAIMAGVGTWSGENTQDLNFDYLDQQPQESYEDYGEGSSRGHGRGYRQGSGGSYYGHR